MRRLIVYIDGFNLYYGIRKTSYRWLNLQRLAESILPNRDVLSVKYFTARVLPFPKDPSAPQRQEIFLRALRTLKKVEIIEGRFQVKPISLPLEKPPNTVVRVLRSEEKGSDVNLASHLLMDAFEDSFDDGAVISADSDLAMPVNMVAKSFGKPIYIFDPRPAGKECCDLRSVATQYRRIWGSVYKKCLLPNPVIDQAGRAIHMPPGWDSPKVLI
ncbi:MAG: NYN domain-containing protein [Candidatus Omnitrophica bacterium]|nr:hypothetical protein [bacterium]NUN94547.1 NYN domain-containing protein [Candidatus Omnitrophota bacterium]